MTTRTPVLLALVLVLVGGACSESPMVAPHDLREQSGTRLKIEWWELADGSQQVRGVYDTQRGVECSFVRGADGGYACGEVAATFDLQHAATRVVPTSVCTPDGLVLPIGFFDTERGVECTPAVTAQHAIVCTPVRADASAGDPGLALAMADTTTRLAPQLYTTRDGMIQHIPSFFDTVLELDCSVTAPSGLCLPPVPALPADAYVAALPTVDP
jgi:hypothetical protein